MHFKAIIQTASKDLLSLEVQVKSFPTIHQPLHFCFEVCVLLRISNTDFVF